MTNINQDHLSFNIMPDHVFVALDNVSLCWIQLQKIDDYNKRWAVQLYGATKPLYTISECHFGDALAWTYKNRKMIRKLADEKLKKDCEATERCKVTIEQIDADQERLEIEEKEFPYMVKAKVERTLRYSILPYIKC